MGAGFPSLCKTQTALDYIGSPTLVEVGVGRVVLLAQLSPPFIRPSLPDENPLHSLQAPCPWPEVTQVAGRQDYFSPEIEVQREEKLAVSGSGAGFRTPLQPPCPASLDATFQVPGLLLHVPVTSALVLSTYPWIQ